MAARAHTRRLRRGRLQRVHAMACVRHACGLYRRVIASSYLCSTRRASSSTGPCGTIRHQRRSSRRSPSTSASSAGRVAARRGTVRDIDSRRVKSGPVLAYTRFHARQIERREVGAAYFHLILQHERPCFPADERRAARRWRLETQGSHRCTTPAGAPQRWACLSSTIGGTRPSLRARRRAATVIGARGARERATVRRRKTTAGFGHERRVQGAITSNGGVPKSVARPGRQGSDQCLHQGTFAVIETAAGP
jgi:hypothetical protein